MDDCEIFSRLHAHEAEAVIEAIAARPELARARDGFLGSTPLHFASHRGMDDVVAALLGAGADVDALEEASGTTALHWAAEGGHARVVERLLDAGADVRQPHDAWFDLPPLGWATVVDYAPSMRDDRGPTVAALVAGGARHDVFTATALGLRDVVGELIAEGVDLSRRLGFAARGMTPLLLAASRGQADLVSMFLDAGADLTATTDRGLAAAALAKLGGHDSTHERLMRAGRGAAPSVALVARDAMALAEELDRAPSELTASRLLHAAAASGFAEGIPVLVSAGAATDDETTDLVAERPARVTPLHLAARADHGATVQALLEAGADVNAGASASRATPLHLAAACGATAAIHALVEAGADTSAREERFGATPVEWAEHAGCQGVLDILRPPSP